VEDRPRTVTNGHLKKTLLYIIDDFRELHKMRAMGMSEVALNSQRPKFGRSKF
jgi:hypothetical protein